ncbi:MAG: hypothetical protein IE909_10045 [Campylobacterales bacterium]|nr:hypothetical protein [Campylobacterales bacterium]
MNKQRLFIFANDAASANVTMAYAVLYEKDYSHIFAYPQNEALEIYQQHIPQYIQKLPDKLNFLPKDVVVTGTSGLNSNYEMSIVKQAKLKGVKEVITIVDNTVNFKRRFLLDNQIIEKKYVPDEIWVFEYGFKSDILFLNQKIIYKENIYLQFLQKHYKQHPPKLQNDFIKKYKHNYLVILSEYVYELYGLSFGFTEYEFLEIILQTICELDLNIPIFLKLHPKEHKNKFNILLRKYSHLNILQDECNIQELIYYSKLVFGINSSVFMECQIFCKPTYSIQINAKKISIPCYLPKTCIITKRKVISKIISSS